ncbi:unnamed protein product [Blepharisma stoltei]|uniref:Exophilin 5 n=1 Tax=Blepharisma stoltei TaxID=1481888 RepID=A0AAU9IJG1_9CILI|nr:unnamed protein product [Blepharisma stoltei]
MKRSLVPPRLKIRARDLEHSQTNARVHSVSELSSPRNSFLDSKNSPVQDPFLNIRLNGSNIPTLRPICPSKRSTPRASTADIKIPTLSLPLDDKIPFALATDSQRSHCNSTKSLAHCQSESALKNRKPNLIFNASKRSLPFEAKQPIKPKLSVPANIKESSKMRAKIKPVAIFDFKREIRTPCFSFNSVGSQKKKVQVSESESCGSESTALPQSGEISSYELTLNNIKVNQGQGNKEAYDRIKKLILDVDSLDASDDPREMSFGNICQMPLTYKRPIKLVSPRMHFHN